MSRLLMKHALARWAVQVSIYCRRISILVLLRLILRLNLGVVKTVLDANPVACKKQQTSSDATTCIILMTCHDLDLRSASQCLVENLLHPIRSTTQTAEKCGRNTTMNSSGFIFLFDFDPGAISMDVSLRHYTRAEGRKPSHFM